MSDTRVEGAVETVEEWLSMLDSVPVTACGVLRYPPICGTEVQAFRVILADREALLARIATLEREREKDGEALERIVRNANVMPVQVEIVKRVAHARLEARQSREGAE